MTLLETTALTALVAAVLTVAVQQVAGRIRTWWIAPVIKIGIDRTKTVPWLFDSENETTKKAEWPAHWLHLVVTNCGRSTAIRTQLLATHLLQKKEDGELVEMPQFLPMCMQWSHSGHPPRIEMDLLPDFSRRANLTHVERPGIDRWHAAGRPSMFLWNVKYANNVESPDLPSKLAICTEVDPSSGCNLLRPGVYELHLAVAAENFKPKTFRLRIEYLGEWSDDADEFRKTLTVDLL